MPIVRRIARWFGLGRLVGIALLAGFTALRLWDPAPLEITRLKIFDLYQQLIPRTVKSNAIVVVDIDETSLKELGQWPWSRILVADLVNRIAQAQPAGIAFDILFSEPDRLSPARFAQTSAQLDTEIKAKLSAMPNNEQALISAFKRTRVVVGQAGHFSKLVDNDTIGLPKTAFALVGGDPKPFLFEYPGLLRNLPELEKAAVGHGLFTIRPDRDGIIRRVPAVMVAGTQMIPALSIELLRAATNAPSLIVKRDVAGVRSIVVAGNEVATDRNSQLWVHFAPYSRARFISASDIIAGTVDAAQLRGKLVFVGTSSVGLFDLRATPLDRVRPGVDIHAELVDNILTKSLLTRPHYAIGAEIVMAALVGLLMIALGPMFGAVPIFMLGAVIAAVTVGAAWYMFQTHKLLFDVVYPLGSSFAIFVGLTFTNYIREELRRNEIRSAFKQYLSPDLVELLSRDPGKLVLGGERRELSILFSDVRGFTSISEGFKDDPGGLTKLMNRLLTPLSNAIVERQGTIDKYMGDAIMAFWNAPMDVVDHPRMACETALEMRARMERLNVQLVAEAAADGRPFRRLDVGIGIATGKAIVGNMGSDLRFDYTVLGDCVNLASRIEGMTRHYDVPILISERTAVEGAKHLAGIEIDNVRVKGKKDAERIFVLVGDSTVATDAEFIAFHQSFAAMRTAYRARDWNAAMQHRERLVAGHKHYGLVRVLAIYAERIEGFGTVPPGTDWDGIYDMETK